MTIAGMTAAVDRINLRSEVPKIIGQTEREIVTLNKEQLYDYSINKESVPLELYHQAWYADLKTQQNPKPGLFHPDLYLTGSFQNAFFIEVGSDAFEISSRDSKTFDLIKKYGSDIFGLTEKSKDRYIVSIFAARLKSYIRDLVDLRFSGG